MVVSGATAFGFVFCIVVAGLQVYYNGVALSIKGFSQYVQLVYRGLMVPGIMKDLKLTVPAARKLILKHFAPVKIKADSSRNAAKAKGEAENLMLSQQSEADRDVLDLSQASQEASQMSQSQDAPMPQDEPAVVKVEVGGVGAEADDEVDEFVEQEFVNRVKAETKFAYAKINDRWEVGFAASPGGPGFPNWYDAMGVIVVFL